VADGHHVLTNGHVVPEVLDTAKRETLVVFVGQGKTGEMRPAHVVARDTVHDVALLQIEGAPLPALTLAAPGTVREGALYAFTGFPLGLILGLHPVTHRGIISAIIPIATPVMHPKQLTPAMIERLKEPFEVLQLDATAYPGNSGSPLYDPETGEVVGILNMVFVKASKENLLSQPSGISYAIPIQHAHQLLKQAELRNAGRRGRP
jgi:S1-C subfamily serine protease